MSKRKVIYVSPVRYPTEKAYGVTIKYTMETLSDLGFGIQIVDPQKLINQKASTRIHRLLLDQLNKRARNAQFSRHNFNLMRLLVGLTSFQKFTDLKENLWTRDPLIAMVINLFRRPSNTIIEIHQNPHLIDLVLLRILNCSDLTILAPISKTLNDKIKGSRLKFRMENVIMCPMGVPDAFLDAATPRAEINYNKVKVGYVGGLYSNGVDQGIKELINLVSHFNQTSELIHLELKLFGIAVSEDDELRSLFSKQFETKQVSTEQRQQHSKLIPKLLDCDIFLLPYPKGDYFDARFPLKALEYAALERPIVASDTPSHRNIFQENEVFYFKLGFSETFFKAILEAATNRELVSRKVKMASAKAKEYSYGNRVRSIVQRIDKE